MAYIYSRLGQHDKALAENLESLRLNPDNPIDRANLVFYYLLLNRFEDARKAAEDAKAKGLDSESLRELLYLVSFSQNDTPGMAKELEWASGRPGVEHRMLAAEADTAAYFGHLGRAREFSRRAVDSARRVGEKDPMADYVASAALREALFVNFDEARTQLTAIGHSVGTR